jgi:CheY-like chemotaxis protein
LSYIQDGTKRMALLIDDLLEYSRVSWKPAPLKPTNLNLVVNQVVTDLKGFIDDSKAEVHVDNLPTVIANPSQIRMVFQNIIANALKFHRPGIPPKIEIRAFAQDDAWQISVRDNGIGIAEEDSDRIFKVFQRLHTQQEYSGNGIGLATCQRIVERFGGRIWVESQHGEGSNFYFSLPMPEKMEARVPINRKPLAQASANGNGSPQKMFEILSVEDSHADARLMMELLQASNEVSLRLKCLNNGADALDYLFQRARYASATPPDLILLDLDLPNYDGLEILRQAKENPRTRRIPILILTGSQRQEDIVKSYDLGANGFMKKPPTLNEFDGLIQAVKAFWLGAATLPTADPDSKPAVIQ